ncbi:MAG: transcriptional repressor [Chloroflexota bacterium]
MHKRTKQKEAILRVLRGTGSHPTADWIYSQVRKEMPNISMGTVYRNLKVLRETGEIRELELAGNLRRFDGVTRSHDHFRCEKCGRVFDVDENVDQGINERAEKKTGFRITGHILEFRGFCRECRQGVS